MRVHTYYILDCRWTGTIQVRCTADCRKLIRIPIRAPVVKPLSTPYIRARQGSDLYIYAHNNSRQDLTFFRGLKAPERAQAACDPSIRKELIQGGGDRDRRSRWRQREKKEKKRRLWVCGHGRRPAGKACMNSRATVARRGRRKRGRETYGPRWVGEGWRRGPGACKGHRKGFIAWLCSLLAVTGQVLWSAWT